MKDAKGEVVEEGTPMPRSGRLASVCSWDAQLAALRGAGAPRHAEKEVTSFDRMVILARVGWKVSAGAGL